MEGSSQTLKAGYCTFNAPFWCFSFQPIKYIIEDENYLHSSGLAIRRKKLLLTTGLPPANCQEPPKVKCGSAELALAKAGMTADPERRRG
jgi:hypothetical protein